MNKPVVVNASDIKKLQRALARNEFHGEHGSIDDPDIFQPTSVGVTQFAPKLTVKADPDAVWLNTANPRTELGLSEVDDLMDALTEARTYLETHNKENRA